jgi:hypothetical protein
MGSKSHATHDIHPLFSHKNKNIFTSKLIWNVRKLNVLSVLLEPRTTRASDIGTL